MEDGCYLHQRERILTIPYTDLGNGKGGSSSFTSTAYFATLWMKCVFSSALFRFCPDSSQQIIPDMAQIKILSLLVHCWNTFITFVRSNSAQPRTNFHYLNNKPHHDKLVYALG
ncbi:hypothetical protein LDENG_00048970 [Lucifuga dentata]|nr:hypothetical protein LDENG_00048970 [Lucifuga dentata]